MAPSRLSATVSSAWPPTAARNLSPTTGVKITPRIDSASHLCGRLLPASQASAKCSKTYRMNTIQARPESAAAAVAVGSPFPDRHTRVLTVGATGVYGQAQIVGMRSAGTRIVANVAVGRGGQAMDGV